MNQKWNSYRSDYDDRLALNLLEDRLNSVHPRQVRVHLGGPNRYVIFPGVSLPGATRCSGDRGCWRNPKTKDTSKTVN